MRRSRRAFLLFAAALGIVLSLTMWQAPTESVAQRSASTAARPDLEGGWVRIESRGFGKLRRPDLEISAGGVDACRCGHPGGPRS